MITDRLRFTIIEVNTNNILTRDLEVKEPEVIVNLSGPSIVTFKIDRGQEFTGAAGINFKTWGQWIIPELDTDTNGRICLGAQLISKLTPDPKSGDLIVEGTGFLGYPKGIPWLENFNPIAVDPAEVIQRIWAHLQSFPNANFEITVEPSSTGTQMLPGFGFDGQILLFDFFAMFIRAADFPDAGDTIMQLARDLPLDLFEDVEWNEDETGVIKKVRIAYPFGGIQQNGLTFRLGENMTFGEIADELEIEPVSDVIVRGWLPGRTYSSQLSNADMTRARRVIMEEAANLSSTERAAAWAKRKLTRRNIPKSFSKITIDPNHPHAPFGTWWVGDSILVEAKGFPWFGDINLWHRITSITIKDSEPTMELGLKVEDYFNFDPIIFDPDALTQPTEDPNLLPNGYFSRSLAGWYAIKGSWIRFATFGYTSDGCVRIDCDDAGEELRSSRIPVTLGDNYQIKAAVRYQTMDSGAAPWTFAIAVNLHYNGGDFSLYNVVDTLGPVSGTGGFFILDGIFEVPTDELVNELSVSLLVNNSVVDGVAFWDDIKVIKVPG